MSRRSIALTMLLSGCATSEVIAVAAGVEHTCELERDGRVRCWGNDAFGALARRTATGVGRPGVVDAPAARALSAGGATTCLVDGDGAVYCFGLNHHGQIGDGTREDAWEPVQVMGLPPMVEVAVGFAHVCARTDAGAVYCWGWNGSGQVASGGPIDVDAPQAIDGLPPARRIAAGYATSCAIDEAERAHCWGHLAPAAPLEGVRAVAAGSDHLCVSRADEVRCFGAAAGGFGDALPMEGRAFALPGGTIAAAAMDHVCLTDAQERAHCFGRNDHGALGDGTFVARAEPTPVRDLGRVFGLAVGDRHSCAVSGGRTVCWGWNDRGQLGDDEGVHSLVPNPVP
jgi:alpha-tubulin suppressor-like RCC1 family protein